MWPHLTAWEVLLAIGLCAVWLMPDWVLKVLAAIEVIHRYRRRGVLDDKPKFVLPIT